jgi:N-acetylmuramoyl-L-alanine amidase
MKRLLLALSIFLLSSDLYAAINVQVIYPRPNQQIALVDSTFILGNVTSGAKLYVNGQNVDVYKSGGWLAFVDVSSGNFNFHVVGVKDNDSASVDLPVIIGSSDEALAKDKYIPKFVNPGERAIYKAGEMFEFSFEAPEGGVGAFWLDKRKPIKMYESYPARRLNLTSAFGEQSTIKFDQSENSLYTGYYRFCWADTGIHTICYQYSNSQKAGNPVSYKFCLDTILAILPEFPPLVGQFTGTSEIVRTAPGLGYKLLYQPPGVQVEVTGMRDNFYEIKLADRVSGFVNVDSVKILPEGAAIPQGKISVITVDTLTGGARVSTEIGAILPYEINESWEGRQLDIDFYGATSAMDWIRYNNNGRLVKLVRWSQPLDGVFRMTIETGPGGIWGYKVRYEGTKFIIELRDRPAHGNMFAGVLKGRKIVIDPGHSHDSGAIGPTGLEEQDANLWIAHELRQMLEKEGATVLMTRYGHENVPLYDRPLKAENWGADLLVSIHNNALSDGINPFYNNGTSAYYYYPHSKALAEDIHRRMVDATGLEDHGLYYGNLVITRHSSVPSVLIECAFMMIPEQEAMLRTDSFQKKCAKAIMEGIKDFLNQKPE